MNFKATLASLAIATATIVSAQVPEATAPSAVPAAPAPVTEMPLPAAETAAAVANPAAPASPVTMAHVITAPTEAALTAALAGNAELLKAKAGDDEAGATKAAPCAACHGMDGNSVDPANPRLAGQSEWFTARQLMLFKTGVRQSAVMAPFAATLSAQDMRDIGAYFALQSGRSGTADDGLITATGPHLGKKLYVVGEQLFRGGDMARGIPACMACHGPTGAGNPGSAFPRLTGQHAGYTQALLTRYRAGEMHGDSESDPNAPIMPAIAKNLTDLEISALATYIEGLHAFDPNAPVAALTPSAAPSQEPVTAAPADTASGAATQDAPAAPGPSTPAAPNAAPQTPAGTDTGGENDPATR